MNRIIQYEAIKPEHLDQLAALYVETFNSEPWNDKWTIQTARKRLQQIMNTEDFFGLCACLDGSLCGGILGCIEQFYNGTMFNAKEFWIKNGMRGCGIGTDMFSELERRLREIQVSQIVLFTGKGDLTEHFYQKQGMQTNPDMIFMVKQL